MAGGKTTAAKDLFGEAPPCTGIMFPMMYAWEGTGVWVLALTKENWDEYNKLPPTFDLDEHTRNLKAHGAIWYANPRDHPGAARTLDMESGTVACSMDDKHSCTNTARNSQAGNVIRP
ncbi:hypothetical protein LTR56_011484 [Elasticomyces elasticus]|nr:hypothetical protein LTR56_011484 [Elasticomyces elasticus]KAK3655922.1 hypothetical protein LTR22_009931 [Elasticomyces elasticus]KAK4921420.1 hypothetical protein LTR49_011074 [Elasticomyces elasticus]KAK5760106.1 hypothetical protein LTS12_009837 [Elasticomyces elasticus]